MTPGMENDPFHILLVEDNPADADLALEALSDTRSPLHRVSVVRDGEEAMQYLRREGPFADAPPPDLMLLDLNLPKKDGREVLAEVRADPRLRRLPVVVLTSSEAERDLTFAYELHANCFVSKPLDLDQFFCTLRAVKHFWLSIAKLPPRLENAPAGPAARGALEP